jgi:PAS domain S-box-containing protein
MSEVEMSKGTVLVVDDKGIVAKDIARLVTKLGYAVVGTSVSSQDAVKKADGMSPDIILMDIKLKGDKDGIDTAEEIFNKHGIPSIYITAYTDDETLDKALKTNPYGYIVKPFEEKVLEIVLELAFRRLRAEKELSASQESFNTQCINFMTILERIPDYLYISDPASHEVIFANQALRNLANTDVAGKKCYKVFQGKTAPCEFCTNKLILQTRQPHVWDYYNEYIGRHFLITDQIIQWTDGRDVRFETAVDITDQKKIEKMLLASESKYRNFIENSCYGFFIMNNAYEITYLNKNAEEIYGRALKPGTKIRLSDVLDTEEQLKAINNLKIISDEGKLDRPGTYNIKLPNGKSRIVEIQTFPIMKDANLEGYHGTVLDITERVEHQNKLKEKSEFLDAVIKNSTEGIFVIDEDFNYVLINPESGRILGHNPDDWVGKRAGSNKHPDDEAKGIESIMQVMSEGSSEVEMRVKSSDSTYHLLHIRYTLMTLNNQDHVLGMVTDITEKRKIEVALRESEERYRSFFNQAVDGVILMPVDSETLIVNQSFARMHGYDNPKEMEHMRLEDLDTPESAKLAPERLKRLISGEEMSFEVEHYHKDGHSFPLFVSCKVFNIGNRPYYMGFHQDISIKRKAEEALKESEEKYRSLFEFSPESIILLDENGSIIECNNVTSKLLGKPQKEILDRGMADLLMMEESEEEYFKGVIESVINGSRVERFELEFQQGMGGLTWIELFPTLIRTEGNFTAIQLLVRDISERKAQEEEVKRKFIRFNLEAGATYMARESNPNVSLAAFKELLTFGYKGMFISRYTKKESEIKMDLVYSHISLSEEEGQNTIQTTTKAILGSLRALTRRSVILFDCMDYIISRFGEKKALNLIQDIHDLATRKKLIVLFSLDPDTVSDTTVAMISKEVRDIRPCESLSKISPKLLEIVDFIGHRCSEGDAPTYSEIGEKLELSKPTVRTRIKQLRDMDIISETLHGRKKKLELTVKGKNYMEL